MTDLAHDAALLGISVDTVKLYEGDDPNYELWLYALTERVRSTRIKITEAQRQEAKRTKKTGG